MGERLTYGSVCSGIEAASVAWHSLGWRASFLSEIEAFPRSVLAHHYPETPLHGDFTTIKAGEYEPIDLLVGGTPCQSFSVAGLRGGLDDVRGNLALEYLRLADRLRPRWLVWENVPGVLSSNGGRDFGSILGGMGELGYGVAYRVLDAQFFGVAQRRRRVFVVGYAGDWRRAAAVLFERHSLSGNPAPRRTSGERAAPTISARPTGGGGLGTDFDLDGGVIAIQERAVCENPSAGPDGAGFRDDGASYTLEARTVPQAVAFALRGRETGAVPEIEGDGSRAGALRAASGGSSRDYVAFAENQRNEIRELAVAGAGAISSIRRGDAKNETLLRGATAVRRLTTRECERLQGFEDDYTLVPHRGKPAADGPRYKALGNSMAVPVMRWIGERIEAVEAIAAASRQEAA